MTKLVGILNVTDNSFSDGGRYNNCEDATQRIEDLLSQGADLIDIGACSTSYNAPIISHEDEWHMLKPILKMKASKIISIDTYNWRTAKKAIEMNVGFINDVSFGKNKEMLSVIASSDVKYILMYSLVLPACKSTRAQFIDQIIGAFKYKVDECLNYGISLNQIIIDPGIGFSTDEYLSVDVIKNVDVFKQFNLPVMIGHSRKSFFNLLTHLSPQERDLETVIASIHLFNHQIDYLRIHNIAMHKRAFKIHSLLKENINMSEQY